MKPPSHAARARVVSLAAIAVLAAIGAWAFSGLVVRHDVTEWIPETEDRELSRIARDVLGSELSRSMIVALKGRDEAESLASARELATALGTVDGVEWVRTGAPPEIERTFYDLYFDRRYAFFAESPEAARAALTDEALSEAAARLQRELGGPTAMLVRRVAPEDPLLAFERRLRILQRSAEGGPRLVDGQLISADGWALVLLASHAPTFDGARIGPLLDAIDVRVAEVRASHPDLEIRQAGIHRFAVRAERAIRADVERISIFSTLGCVLLFLLLYRGLRFLALGAIPLAVGTICAVAACRLAFGGVHGITLAFGSSLLGVGIDYVAHYVNHHVLSPSPDGPDATMRKVWPGLALGAVTTIAGLAGLAWTAFPGMREMAVFAAVGVTGALLATRLIPPWMPVVAEPTAIARSAERLASRTWGAIRRGSRVFLALPVLALIVVAIGLPRLTWIDDIRALNASDPELLAEDREVRERVAQGEAGRFVIATGATDEEALQRNDRAYDALVDLRERGVVRAFRSVHPLLPSAERQRAVLEAVRTSPALVDRTLAALAREGFVTEAFEPFRASLGAHDALRWEDLAASGAAELARPFRITLDGGRVGYLSFVEGVRDPAALRDAARAIDGVDYFDQPELLASAYRTFRARTTELLALGMLVVLGACVVRYRSLRLGVLSIAPALLAAATSLGVLGLLGQSANLMHLVGALLVLSMGEDFAVFLLEMRDDDAEVGATMVGIFVACVTTVLSFGLLATSSHPALRALGAMVSLGVLLSMILAPIALLLAKPRAQ